MWRFLKVSQSGFSGCFFKKDLPSRQWQRKCANIVWNGLNWNLMRIDVDGAQSKKAMPERTPKVWGRQRKAWANLPVRPLTLKQKQKREWTKMARAAPSQGKPGGYLLGLVILKTRADHWKQRQTTASTPKKLAKTMAIRLITLLKL